MLREGADEFKISARLRHFQEVAMGMSVCDEELHDRVARRLLDLWKKTDNVNGAFRDMPIPNADTAFVPPEKLSDYLLNEHHPVGGSKAKWFRSLGYDPASPSVLGDDILKQVQSSADFTEKNTGYGTKYVVSGKISTPSGDIANITTVWIVEPSDRRPRLVTAFPGEKS